ncbi:MAG: hypothetical protein Q9190_007622, partial [Brigantiaea leucoxantha]
MCELVNLVIKCTGCDLEVDVHEIEDPDNATSKLEDLQNAYHAQTITDYPLISKAKGYTSFRAIMTSFFDSLINACHGAGVLYTDLALIENFEIWATAMSSSYIRPFRHTATVICLAIESALCDVASEIAQTTANTMQQKENEKKKKKVNKERVAALQAKITEQERRRETVAKILEDIFSAVYVHRYRDVDPKIRLECVTALGKWITSAPDHFFSGSYLRYLGWVMSDPSAPTRAEVIKQLSRLFKNKDNVARLRAFTERFRPRLVEIAVRDAETGIRASAVELLDLVRDTGLLEPDDIDSVGRLIFDNEPKVRSAVSAFFAENINDMLESVVEEVGGQEGLAEAIGEDPENDFDLPRRSWLKYKCLAEVLQSYSSEDNGEMNGTTQQAKEDLAIAGTDSIFSLAAHVVYKGVEEVKAWEILAGYLLYDFSILPQNQIERRGQSVDSPEIQFRRRCQLSETEEMILLEVLNVAVKQKLTETIEAETDKRGKTSKARIEESRKIQESTALRLAQVIPNLLKKFGANPVTASTVLRLEHVLNLKIFQQLRQDSTTYASLLDDINRQFLTHVDRNVLTEASNALLHARGFEDLEEITESKVQQLWVETTSTLRGLVAAREQGRTTNISNLCNTLRRISNLASISDCVGIFNTEQRAKSKRDNVAMTISPLSMITNLISENFTEEEEDTDKVDEIIITAIKACLFYYMWLVRSLKNFLVDNTPAPPLPDYGPFAESLISVMNARSGADSVRLAAASAYLDLFTLFASLRHAKPTPASNSNGPAPKGQTKRSSQAPYGADDIASLIQPVPPSIQTLIHTIFATAEKSYARISRRVLDKPAPDDPVDDAPLDLLSDSDDDDEEESEEGEERKAARLVAEKELCELAGKMVLAVLAGALDAKVKERLLRNKGRLGPNFKEVVVFLDWPKPKQKRKTPAKVKSVTKNQVNTKSRELVEDE